MGPRRLLALLVLLSMAPLGSPPGMRAADGVSPSLPAGALLHSYPQIYQSHTLSCEAAAASMATAGRLTEASILAAMPYNPNPWLGFRGNLDRSETWVNGLANYGIYAPPLAAEMQHFGYQTTIISGTYAPALLRYTVGVLHLPVVVWVTYGLADWPPITGHAGNASFPLILGEHARLVVGYNAAGVYSHDPIDGVRYNSWAAFLRSWLKFDNMGLILAPVLPRPAPAVIHQQQWGGAATWTWRPPPWPLVDEMTVFRYGKPVRRLVLAPSATLSGVALPAATDALVPDGIRAVVLSPATLRQSALSPTALLSTTQPLNPPPAISLRLVETAPFTITVHAVDPLGLTSTPFRTIDASPPLAPWVHASIAAPGTVRWSWAAQPGYTYRVQGWRYGALGPLNNYTLDLSATDSFTRTVAPGSRQFLRVAAVDDTGLASTYSTPTAAPVIEVARLTAVPTGTLHAGGYATWHWAATGAVRYIVTSWAYAGSSVVDRQTVTLSTARYSRRLLPDLAYRLTVHALANDGSESAPAAALRGLVYRPPQPVTGLSVARLPGGWQQWRWRQSPATRYRLELLRYSGSHAEVVLRMLTDRATLNTPPARPHTTDYLRVWSVDAQGDAAGPVVLRGAKAI